MSSKLKRGSMNLLKLGLLAGGMVISLNQTVIAQAAVATEEKTAVSLYNEGLDALKAKNYALWLSNMEMAIEKAKVDKNDKVVSLAMKNGGIAAYNLGNEYLKQDLVDSAKMTFDRGMALNDKYGSLYLGQARVLEAKESIPEAMEQYLMYAKISKEENDVKRMEDGYNRGKNMLIRQFNDKKYETVVSIGTSYLAANNIPDAHYLVGKSNAELGKQEVAVDHYLKSVEGFTAAGEKVDDKVYYALGEAYEALSNSPKAIEFYGKITDAKYLTNAKYKIEKLSSN